MLDKYTKLVLTVIALALVVIVLQNFASASKADFSGLQKVQICDETACVKVDTASRGVALLPVYNYQH